MKQYIIIPKERIVKTKMPRFNGFKVGHGPHRNKKKYQRKSKYPWDPE